MLSLLRGIGGAAGPASDFREARVKDRNLKEAYLRAVELKEAVVRQGAELQALQKAYESDLDPSRFAVRRESVRLELATALAALEIARKKFLVLGSAIIYTRAFGVVARKPNAPMPPEEDFLDMSSVNRFDKALQRTHRGWEAVMKGEPAAFAAARRRAAQRRAARARLWAGGVAGILALLAAAVYRYRLPGPAAGAPGSGTPRTTGRTLDWAFGSQWAVEREGKPAVVRLLSEEFSNIGREAERMAGLVRAATAFRHPGVQEVYEIGTSPDGVYLVMEPPVGRPLSEVLASGQAFGAAAALAVMAPVARALDAAHAAGSAHGALTPERILILPGGSVRIEEFGLARALATRAASRGKVFSPAYAAPEVMDGKITLPSDLFAFGVILYEALFVRLPFEGANLAVLKQERRFPAPSALLKRPTPRTDAFFAGLLEPAARRRRPKAGGLAAALEAISELSA